MATVTKVVIGRYYDGVTSATSGYVAKKINDVVTAAASVISVSTFKVGDYLGATIVYTT